MKSKLLITSIATVIALSGCASMPDFQADKGRVAKASIVGCAGGALLAKVTGNSDNALRACAGGAVVAGVASYTAQVKEAKAVEEAARQAGLNAQVQTQEVGQGSERKSELKELRLQYDPNDLRNPSAETSAVFDKLATLIKNKKAGADLKVELRGSDKTMCVKPAELLKARGVLIGNSQADHASVSTNCVGQHEIVISPITSL
ncbi:hypothetical protein [Stenotrophomonas maltophilia]|uniref:hypothetical protein n=1 Tax=Stenotrophomonas maltophilia TaxID=40324 RepID=UPI001180F5B6|nr:hypothetical protein [Stenotrophomonas maltophilia]